jgi:heme-degrading monooxygenase HmoA
MVLVISRFRVANAKDEEVRKAFLNRPRLVENAPGFLNLEVFTERGDPSCFYLVTRWNDVGAFQAWHRSEAHRQSHEGIPSGLKLDASYTKILTLDPITDEPAELPSPQFAWIPAALAGFLQSSQNVHYFYLTPQGVVCGCNSGASAHLRLRTDEIIGRNIGDFLTSPDAEKLAACLDRLQPGEIEKLLLNFVGTHGSPYSLDSTVTAGPVGFSVLGEPAFERERHLSEELLQLNNQITVLARESARQKKELGHANLKLEKALQDLRNSYWHIRKIHEVLPVCLGCGKVKSTDTTWEDVGRYLKKNLPMLSHGYCPECFEKIMRQFDDPAPRSEG